MVFNYAGRLPDDESLTKKVIGSNGDSLHLTTISESVRTESIADVELLKVIKALKTVS